MAADLPARGAYGIALSAPLAGHPALRDLSAPRGHLTLTERPAQDSQALILSPDRVQILLADGSYLDAMDAGGGTYRACLSGGPTRTQDDLVHPYLAPIAALIHRWRGVPALHGAALGGAHGAVALLGERESGKSTTAAALVASGLSLLSDDLVVVDQGCVLPGPLSVDLRPSGAELLGLSGERVRGGQRLRRLAAEPVGPAPESRLRLIVHLEFGPTTQVRKIPISQRLSASASQLYWPGVGSPARDLLALTALPQVVLQRPRGATGLAEAVAVVQDLLHQHSDCDTVNVKLSTNTRSSASSQRTQIVPVLEHSQAPTAHRRPGPRTAQPTPQGVGAHQAITVGPNGLVILTHYRADTPHDAVHDFTEAVDPHQPHLGS